MHLMVYNFDCVVLILGCCACRSKKEDQAVPKSISLSLCDVDVSASAVNIFIEPI
jgi:hypothetical protein